MKKKIKILIIIIFSGMGIILTGCSERLSIRLSRWSGAGAAPESPESYKKTTPFIRSGETYIEFQPQTIEGVEVENSFYKKISRLSSKSKGEVQTEFLSYQWLEKLPFKLKSHLFFMKKNEKQFLIQMNSLALAYSYPDLKDFKMISKPQIVLRPGKKQSLCWRVYLESRRGEVIITYWDQKFNLIEKKKHMLSFTDGLAQIYPEGPLKSPLSHVILKKIDESGNLSSQTLKISTQSEKLAQESSHQFVFSPEDPRFRQVQVYYYLSQSLNWFHDQFHFELPFQLIAETSMGYPEKTNTAFYFNQKIRLGEGDGITFQKMDLDPSIVIHESVHSVIDVIAKLSAEGQGGSINEGFSDFFTCVQLANPRLAEASYLKDKFKRNIENDLSYNDQTGGLYHDSQIVSGFFWELTKEIGTLPAQRLAWDVLMRLTPTTQFEDLKLEIKELAQKQPKEISAKIDAVLRKRKWIN